MVCIRLLTAVTRICLKMVLLCLAAANVSLACQTTLTDKAPAATSTAKVTQRGRVVNSITGEPVPFALVQLPGTKPLRAMLTGADGSFEFANVPAMLEINARKPGFLAMGGSRGTSGSTVQISTSGEPVTLALVPEAVIAGHITDAKGEPMEGVKVKIYHFRIMQGYRTWQGVAEDMTDDEGSFRAAELEAGQYYIVIQPDKDRTQSLGPPHPNQSRRGYRAIIYYPDNGRDISALELGAGQHIDIPIALNDEPVYQVSGHVAGYKANQPTSLQIFNDRGEEFAPATNLQDNGAFTIQGLAAGVYTISVLGPKSATQSQLAEATIQVTSDVKGLQLRPFEITSIPIKLTTQFTNPVIRQFIWHGKFNLQALVRPVEARTETTGVRAQLSFNNRSLVLQNLTPGTYSVQFTTPLGYVSSAMCGSTDLLRENLVVLAGTAMPPIEVVLRDDTGTLTGSTQEWDWTTVVVASDSLNVPPQTSRVPGHSTFSLAVPPGSYKVYAFPAGEEIEYANPAVLKHYASHAAQVSVTAGSTSSIKVDPIRAEN